MRKVTFYIRYPAGHTYEHTWVPAAELHCPCCGRKEVWHDNSEGDYYFGVSHLCMSCKALFYLPVMRTEPLDEVGQQVYDAIQTFKQRRNDDPRRRSHPLHKGTK